MDEKALERQLIADHFETEKLERRERIATAALQGFLTGGFVGVDEQEAAVRAVKQADALIAALDEAKQ